MKIAVIDYEAGNLRSVETALKHLGADFVITKKPEEILKADRAVFPGVGDAGASMKVLTDTGIGDAIKEFVKTGKRLLGICIGCQILLDRSEERNAGCLGIIPGHAALFPVKKGFKVPHMGWNPIHHGEGHEIFKGIPDGASFYFVHSYYPVLEDKSMEICSTDYILPFSSGYAKDNVTAFQFHPEKSGPYGLRLIQNFIEMGD